MSWLWYLEHEQRARRWYALATACGLANVRVVRTLWFARHLEGDAGPLRVVLTSESSQTGGAGSVIVTGVAAGLATSAAIGPGDPLPPVGGPPLLRAALFDAVTRRLVTGLFESQIERDDGHVELFPCGIRRIDTGVLWLTHDGPLTKDALSAVLEVARRLRPPDALEPAVAALLRSETDPACRLYALRALLQQAPDHPAAGEAARACLEDAAPEVRLLAALAMGDAGRDVLLRLAASSDVPDHVSERALGALGASLPSDALADRLRAAIARRRPLAAVACARILAGRGPDEAAAPLVHAVASADVAVVLAAADALGRIGETAEVVLALREAEARHASDRVVRNATREAVAAVKARLQGAEAGQLSVAADAAGRIGLADDAQGRVALPPSGEPPEV